MWINMVCHPYICCACVVMENHSYQLTLNSRDETDIMLMMSQTICHVHIYVDSIMRVYLIGLVDVKYIISTSV